MSKLERRRTIETPRGPVSAVHAAVPDASAMLVVAHGAGAGMEHPFVVGFCRSMADHGIATLRFNFPYIEAGRRSPDPAPVAVAAVLAAVNDAGTVAAGSPVFAGGKSFGGRMASMAVAEGAAVSGLVFLGYPLHPPGKPDRVRDEHLYDIDVPMLFLQGTADPFATPAVLNPVVHKLGDRAVLASFEDAGHSFEVRAAGRSKPDATAVGASLAPVVAAFIHERSRG
jgi:predicted alpha/beta-hydrolase family hydrolase